MSGIRQATGWRLAATALLLLPVAALADCGPAALEPVVLERIAPDGALLLRDARLLRLAGLQAPPATGHPSWPKPGERLAIGLLDDRPDRWGRLPALVFAVGSDGTPAWLQERLVGAGLALARPEAGLRGCWPLLARAEAEAARPPDPPREAGRFARVEGRVRRVGEGRGAVFLSLVEPDGARVAGMVRKRLLPRLKQAGVDVQDLRGHVIRLRGTRSVTNPAVIPVMMAEQIEIVR
jgi:hypothetical protein